MIDLQTKAQSIFGNGKGLLAADESVHTATKRLAEYGVASTPETRRQFRELFLGTEGVEQYLSGVILFEETMGQTADDGRLFPQSLIARGIQPGIKVDGGTEPSPDSPKELITSGLLGLPDRLTAFAAQGATFTKWRAVVTIEGDRLPTAQNLHENMKRLASYAKEVQAAGMVPLLEPEVLLTGSHSRVRAKAVLVETLGMLFSVLEDQAVDASAVVLKTAMALTGSDSPKKDTPEEVAEDTVAALMEAVPKHVAGIVFLSGGQSPEQATENLAAIAGRARSAGAPWPLTFSYARALQEEALALWKGEPKNVPEARRAFMSRLERVSRATLAGA
jgi:fructose-bisphosphate aldolase class I